jgi:hypothetical protein
VAELLWVGLAEVKPANPDVFGGAEGAYVWAVASARSADEFRALVSTALEAQDVELADVEEVEPLLERSERSPLTRELAELAVEAARSRETAVGTFHVYESGDDEEAEGDAATMLSDALAAEQLVEIERTTDDDMFEGYVVGVGEEWLLLQKLDPEIRLGGYAALRIEDVATIAFVDDEDAFANRALRLRGEAPVPQPDVALGDVRALLASAQAAWPLVAVHVARADGEALSIGRVRELEDEVVVLATVDVAGQWSDPERLRLADVTRVEFGGGYEEALALVVSAPDD